MSYSSLQVAPVHPSQERNFQDLMQAHHYLGALPKIGNTIWYVATAEDQWLALLSFSAPALKCSARDEWIGWSYRHQYDRLNLV
ncbi:Druantia anti-phage system protein DruA, partial [Nitrosomonas sp.]